MKFIELIKSEFGNFGKYERYLFPIIILVICIISYLMKDNKIALISAICGISYTILAGKGRVSCYLIGIIGTFCYSYIAYTNGFYANLALYALYYLPMDVIGIYTWSRHLKKNTREIKKAKLSVIEKTVYFLLTIIITIMLVPFLYKVGDKNPVIDAFTTVLSILGQFLTVKRCIEQWYVWFIANLLSLIMWIIAYKHGSNCLATIIMWLVYLILAVYFLYNWKKEIKIEDNTKN